MQFLGKKSKSFSRMPNIINCGSSSRYRPKVCWSQVFKLFQNSVTTGHEVKRWRSVSSDKLQKLQDEVAHIFSFFRYALVPSNL